MARPRSFATVEVVDAVKDLFWARGYEATSISDLEERTGLNRSSLYQAFGSKRELFDVAFAHYVRKQIDPVLAGLERRGAGRSELVEYLATLARTFRSDPRLAARGCLVVNTMTELGGRDPEARAAAAAYRDRVTAALANALGGAAGSDRARRRQAGPRARILCAAVVGALVCAHFDPLGAASLCDDLAAEFAAV